MTDKSYVPPIGRVLTPYLCCRDTAKAIDRYDEVFGAKLAGPRSSERTAGPTTFS